MHGGIYKDESSHIHLSSINVLELLNKAEKIFEHSLTIPTSGNRSLFWLIYCRSLKRILLKSESLFQKNDLILDTHNIV
jgi:hypothetical protein